MIKPIGSRSLIFGLATVLMLVWLCFLVEEAQAADPFLLDDYPNAYAAYSLSQLRSGYAGSAIRVRRGTDGVEQDFDFTSGGVLDVAAIESWLGGADGYVVRWYSQVAGEPDLVQTTPSEQPAIAIDGKVTTDSGGHPAIYFDSSRNTYLAMESALSAAIPLHDMMSMLVAERITSSTSDQHILNFQNLGDWSHYTLSVRLQQDGGFQTRGELIDQSIYGGFSAGPSAWIINTDGPDLKTFNNHSKTSTSAVVNSMSESAFVLGNSTKNVDSPFEGYVTALVVFPGEGTDDAVQRRYDILNEMYQLGPLDYNGDAILPQKKDWQVALYNWMETINVSDVTLPARSFTWGGGPSDVDDVADVWMQLEGASASRVVRGEPEWYVLDAGNSKGIEATGTVRIWHEPEHGHGNPPRSWSNEPAFLYQLSVPNGGGSEGNPYYQMRALGLRALVVAAADMMMYAEEGGYGTWTDMYGKALLGWAEAYRWCKNELPPAAQQAFEDAFAFYLDRAIANGARAVNTNMDMFAMHAAAEIYMATDDNVLKSKAIQAVKRTLFGYPDGELETKHDVFATGGYENGVFAPAGYIMEGDQPDIFYMGESMYQLMGGLTAVTDRETGSVEPDWAFLEEVLRRMENWYMHEAFSDPGRYQSQISDAKYYQGAAGFAGRTGAGFPSGQADFVWRDLALADYFEVSHPRLYEAKGGHVYKGTSAKVLPEPWEMEEDIQDKLSGLTSQMESTYEGTPPEWRGWSPWTKPTPYLPPTGWYSRLKSLSEGPDASVYLPIDRDGYYYNKMFGGPPTGGEYWAYKQNDGTRDFGFFVEAHARQGGYGGWYGGKLEAFWTESTGVVIINRHGKTGCDGDSEDSMCWDNIEKRAAHHVWGRDENGNAFTTLHLRGRDLQRTSTFNVKGTSPTVQVVNVFNDPSHASNPTQSETGEQTGYEIEGSLEIANVFEAQSDGLRITHTLTSDQADEVTELWTSIPVFMRAVSLGEPGDQPQIDYDDTLTEYWDGIAWQSMPEDTDADGTPEFVTTTSLRLGRDFLQGDGMQYAYIAFESSQRVRLSEDYYSDPYQTKTRVRTVHIDLHGNPGTAQPLPAEKSVTYTVQTTDPTGEGGGGATPIDGVHKIPLEQGWNLVSTAVAPEDVSMEAVFAGIASSIDLVRTQSGALYDPDEGLDEIGTWDADEAYAIFAKESTTLSMEGTNVDPTSTTFALQEGWNWVPYPLKTSMVVTEALASILDQLLIVKDEDGRAYSPLKNVDSLGSMRPGKGYKLYVKQAVTLTYPNTN